MTTTTEQAARYPTTISRTEDGVTVRYWSVYRQQWTESAPERIPDAEMAAMSREDREAVLEACPEKTITIYSHPGAPAVRLDGVFGSEVDLRVVSTVDGRGEEPGCTVLEVAAQDVAHVESALDDMDAVASYSTHG